MATTDGLDCMVSVKVRNAIGASSQTVASGRALESEREDALFVDPLAQYFAGPRESLSGPMMRLLASVGVPYVAVRTHFIDSELMDALTAPHAAAPSNAVLPKQVVLLGAGMDTRYWRLPKQEGDQPPADAVFELDQDEVLEAKDTILGEVKKQGKLPAPRLARRRVTLTVDIRDPKWIDALVSAGYDPASGTVWILEGFLRFFSPQQVEALLEQMSTHSACGSSILATVPLAEVRRLRVEKDPAEADRQWRFGTDDPVAYFSRFGWKAVKNASVVDLQREYKRVPRSEQIEGLSEQDRVLAVRSIEGNTLLRAIKVA